MGYFEEYDLDSRFKSVFTSWHPGKEDGYYHIVIDWDQRRTISVYTPEGQHDEEFIFEALEEFMDDLPPYIARIAVSNDLELLSTASDRDMTKIPFYPSPADFSPKLQVPKVYRSQMTEIERLGLQVDHTTYEPTPGETRHVVFKYYTNEGNVSMFWREVNCTLRIPSHPNIVPLDRLVIDSVTASGPEMVVGFTTPFIAGGTIADNVSRIFRLEHLRQLTTAIDYLNLSLGVAHGDISIWNLLIDPETDRLKLFDFNLCAKFGHEENRNDVKLAIITVFEIITRDHRFREEDYYADELAVSTALQMEDWEQHPDVRLEEGVTVSEYRRVLDDWVQSRKQGGNKELQGSEQAPAPGAIDWPPMPEFSPVDCSGTMLRRPGQPRRDMIKRGEPFIKWQRPPTSHLPLPAGKRLLATGEVVDDIPQATP
ncbi:uncharacterized protein B0H64DRAFT_406756 [Chaetomium fimeti]|uniref:Protein kinase domain-containing protein n=1 Tax=Chaetomium fimeti TaxID=1854472 RepID=A0AAE0H9K2_9PEZI|nr:hypothetical protein B0H64DRAFT_406756 [Chaetomium fimeti]